MGLGPLHTIGLSEARSLAADARRLKFHDIDPIEARRSKLAKDKLQNGSGDNVRTGC